MIPKQPDNTFPFDVDVDFQTGDIVFAVDRLGSVVYWNGVAESTSGFRADEVLGKHYVSACGFERGVVDLAAILDGRDFTGGVRCHVRGGGDAMLYLFATVGRDRTGRPAGVVFVGRDVTGLWRAEEIAQAAADKYRLLFENTPDAVAIADMEGHVLEANPACLRLYGYAAADVKGVELADVVVPEDRREAAKAMASLAAGMPATRTIRVRRRDGGQFVAELAASVVVLGGERRIVLVTRDVTDRVRAEAARNQSERMYRAVFEAANDAVFIESVDGRILDVNRNGCELLGYRRNELVNMSVSDLVPVEARAWLSLVTDTILRVRAFRAEAVNLHKSGRHIPVEVSASAMELDGRTVVLAIVRDISQRRQAEQVLRESEEKFRIVAEQSPNMIFINRQGRVAYVNQKGADVMGYTREEFYAPGFDFTGLIAPESVAQVRKVYARHASGEDVGPYEHTLVTKEGQRIESIITTKLIDYEGAKAILGIVTDITDRKRIERRLRDSEEQFRRLVELSPDGVAVHQDGQVVLANPAGARILGYERPDQMIGREVLDFLHPEERPAMLDRMARALADGQAPSASEAHFRRRDGSYVQLEVANARIEWKGSPAVQVVFRDVTERKRAEQALAASEERYRNLVESSPDGIAVYQDGVVVLANRASAKLLGYHNGADLVGRRAESFVVAEDLPRVDEQGELLRGGAATVSLKVRFLCRSGDVLLTDVAGAITTWRGQPAVQIMVRPLSNRPG
ncbi:MAG TPA: PAS domain S-box protein [bacterium]|nr:PAS domain S-box protein [bacterium]